MTKERLLWIVEAYLGGEDRNRWEDIRAPRGEPAWKAVDAGHAFKQAVLDNPLEHLRSTSYRVLPFDGGATFNVGVNIDAVGHESE